MDNPEHVNENRRRAMEHLNYQPNALITVNNVHGNQVHVVDQLEILSPKPIADAMVTKLDNIVLASDSADCPIVLFADAAMKIIGLAHAGWKGAKLGVINNTIEKWWGLVQIKTISLLSLALV